MLTADGCRSRVARFLATLRPSEPLLLGDPIHLRYFANCYIDPFSLGGDFGGYLKIEPDGKTTLYHDNRAPKSVEAAFVDQRVSLKWYDGQTPGQGPRRMMLRDGIVQARTNEHIHDAINDAQAAIIHQIIGEQRRAKDPDELDVLRACMRATDAGHAWARANVKPGMTELDVYAGILAECTKVAGHPVIVYGDFTVSPGSAKRGGMATNHVIQPGETLILDFSVVIQGYRSDFTNTLVVGAEPTERQRILFDRCVEAMAAGERELKAGAACQAVYDAVRGAFVAAGWEKAFPHHAGHGLGLSHPEPPFFVASSQGVLIAGDVVTLEPGLYVDGVGGVRIEHNYLVTDTGFERLSHHEITLRGIG
jgi:Xaa-Pro aminopeptidase